MTLNSPARMPIDVGSVIADTYTIEGLIGRGGMGSVFVASHKRLPGKKVAIKMLHAELSGDEVMLRFKREAEIASRLGHPNIAQVHDFNVLPDGTPYLVMEHLAGESLAQRLKQGPIPLEQVMSIVRQIASALAAAHREGIVHRDLKPQNIFLVPTEVDGRVVEVAKVLDFGISKIRGSQTVKTQESSLLGTPQYMAPEQATGQHSAVDERTDVFALGAIVYEMLSGHPAFSGDSIPEVVFKVVYEQPVPLSQEVPSLPPGITSAIQTAMAKPAAERFATVSSFVEALTGTPLSNLRPPSLPPPDVGFASGSRLPNTGNDAFAQTMGSGDHGAAPAVSAPVSPSAPTIDSQRQPAAPLAPPAPKRTGTVIVACVAAAAIAAVAIYVVTRPGHDEPRANAPQVAVVADAAVTRVIPVAVTPDAAVARPDAAIAKPDAARLDAAAGKATKPAVVESSEPEDETTRQKLDDAQAAIDRKDWDRAEQLTGAVITGETSGPRQKSRGHMLRGIVDCLARNDEERARAELRALDGAPKNRAHLLKVCKDNGQLREDQ